MPEKIKNYDNKNQPIIDASHPELNLTYFNLVRLKKGETFNTSLAGFESVYVVMSGTCDITVNNTPFEQVGQRKDIWSGNADSVYAPIDAEVQVTCVSDQVEIAVAGGKCNTKYEPFRVTPDEVEMVDVGSPDTHSRRRIFHVLGHNAKGRAGNLLVSELFADGGCWNGYPPHKHDTDHIDGENIEETAFEEVYHYRFNPENGFGGQFVFDDNSDQVYMTRSGDTVIIDKGYHPTVTSPCNMEYIFTILVGHTQRSLIQNFKEEYRPLMDKIPGIGAMRDKFKQ